MHKIYRLKPIRFRLKDFITPKIYIYIETAPTNVERKLHQEVGGKGKKLARIRFDVLNGIVSHA